MNRAFFAMSMKFGLKIHHNTARMMIVVAIAVFGIASVKLVDNALARDQVQESHTAAPNGEKVVTIHDRGQERSIVTTVGTVKEALKAADISVDEKHDVVEPSLDTQLVSTKYNVNVYRARPVTVADGTHRVRVVTAQQTTPLIAQAAGVTVYPEDKTTIEPPSDFLLDGADVILKIHRATPLQLTLYGKTTEVRTMARTVGDLLREKNVTLGKDDGLSVPESTPITAGMHLSVWRNGKQTVTVEEEIAAPVEQVKDANRETGFKQVKEAGAPGKKNVTYEIEMRNGQEISRRIIASVTTVEPKKRVEIVGAKSANTFSGSFSEALARLRSCEGSYTSNTGNGYYGAYQFDKHTWGGFGGYSVASEAPPSVQDEKAWQTYKARGWQPWPSCKVRMGLQDIYR